MMDFKDLASLAAHFERLASTMSAEGGLEKAAKLLEDKAKETVGEYHDAIGPVPAWADLADATKADRVAKGFPEDEPLLRTGELRDSISHEVRGNEAWVGSDSEIAEYHETGTSRMPPPADLCDGALWEHRRGGRHDRARGDSAYLRVEQGLTRNPS